VRLLAGTLWEIPRHIEHTDAAPQLEEAARRRPYSQQTTAIAGVVNQAARSPVGAPSVCPRAHPPRRATSPPHWNIPDSRAPDHPRAAPERMVVWRIHPAVWIIFTNRLRPRLAPMFGQTALNRTSDPTVDHAHRPQDPGTSVLPFRSKPTAVISTELRAKATPAKKNGRRRTRTRCCHDRGLETLLAALPSHLAFTDPSAHAAAFWPKA